MVIQTLPQLLWKGWQEAFPERVNGATVLTILGANDRKARSADDQAVGVDHVQRLALGQPYGQRIARPKLHWAALASEGKWTPIEHGNAVHGLLGELKHARDWPGLKERMECANLWTLLRRASVAALIDSILNGRTRVSFLKRTPQKCSRSAPFTLETVSWGGRIGWCTSMGFGTWSISKPGNNAKNTNPKWLGTARFITATRPDEPAVKGLARPRRASAACVQEPVLFGARRRGDFAPRMPQLWPSQA